MKIAFQALFFWPAVLLFPAITMAEPAALGVFAHDIANNPISGVQVLLKSGTNLISAIETDATGRARISDIAPGSYDVEASKDGFITVVRKALDVTGGSLDLDLTMVAAEQQRESVDVHATPSPIEESTSAPSQVQASVAKELPGRPPTVADALPLIPGVVRSPEGQLKISGAGEHRSALIVNSADVTDPATGQFGPTIPIDIVETISVFQTPFLAQYGRFTSGLVSVETKRGGDQWRFDMNDPFPDFRFRSWHLVGVRDATPRVNFSGPLLKNKFYISEGVEYEIRKTPVITLPFPLNQQLTEGFNSFTQFDYILSDRQILTATFHVAPQRRDFVNLNFFNPEPVTPNAKTNNYAGAIADKYSFKGGLLESTLAVTEFDARISANSDRDMVITPIGNSGGYFSTQDRGASRVEWLETYSPAPINGTHQLKFGTSIAGAFDNGHFEARPIDILGFDQLLEQIAFTSGSPFDRSDMELAFFGQDHWLARPNFALDIGLRAESQRVTETFRLAPRFGAAWTPFGAFGTVIRGGFGLFYDHVPLNVYEFSHYPEQVITTYNPDGSIANGPVVYENVIGEVLSQNLFVRRQPVPGNFDPHSATANIQIEQPLTSYLKLRAGYLYNRASDLITLNPVVGTDSLAQMILSGNGRDRYQQLEITARFRLADNDERQLFFSYVHSTARGDLNDFSEYLGSFPTPIIRPDQFGVLPADLPNRFLAWGLVKLPSKFRIAPLIEYRNGLPYIVTDAAQQYAAIPNSTRFPHFLSIDARVSRDFKVNPKYTVRLSVSGYNLTNHFNPDTVWANTAAPQYGLFFGQHKRRYTADFDILF